MFWIGILVGIFIGANIGIILAGLLFASNKDEEQQVNALKQVPFCVMKNKTPSDDKSLVIAS